MTLSEGTNTIATGLDANSVCLYKRVIPLTTDKVVYVYQDTAVNGYVRARVVTVSGTTISSIGAETIISQIMGNDQFHPVQVSATGFVVVGRDANTTIGRLIAVSCTISGSTITAGSETNIEGTAGTVNTRTDFSAGKVDTDKVVAVYGDRNNSVRGTARTFTVTGTIVNTPGAAHIFATAAITYPSADEFPTTAQYALATYITGGDVTVQVLDITGTTTSSGTALTIASTETYQECGSLGMSSTVAFATYEQTTGIADTGHCHYLTRSGTTLTNVSNQGYGSATAAVITHGHTRMDDNVSIITFQSSDEQAQEIYLDAGTLTVGTPLTLDSPGANANLGIALAGGNRAVSIHNTTDIAVISTTLVSSSTNSTLWLRNATPAWSNIGDTGWSIPVQAVALLPGTNYQTIYAVVGTSIYKTTNGGSSWSSIATLTFTPSSIFLVSATKLIAYTNASAGTNRVAEITNLTTTPVITYLDTGHSTTGKGTTILAVA